MIDVDKIKKRSQQGAIMSIVGFVIIIISFLFASIRLNKVNSEIMERNKLLDSISSNYLTLVDSLSFIETKMDSLHGIILKLSMGQSYIDFGIKEYYSGNFGKAILYYDTAIAKYDNNSAAYSLKGQAEIVIRHYNKAEKDLLKSLSLDSLRPQTYYSLILLYNKLNNFEKSFYYLEKLLDIAPQFINQIKFASEMSPLVLNNKFGIIDRENKKRLEFIQTELKRLNYYKGNIDLYPGKETIDAIIAFQKTKNLNETGSWDINTLKMLDYK